MFLTDEEQRMMAGEYGPGMRRAVHFLVTLGDSSDAEKLIPVTYAHVNYDGCPEDFWNLMTDGVSGTPHRVTTHPAYQPELWREWGLPLAYKWIDEHQRKCAAIERLGWLRSETCAEYLMGIVPQRGDAVSMAGTCMQIANNSLFGARVDRMGTLAATAVAVCGRTPLMGLLLPENRYATYLVQVENVDVSHWTLSHYHCLGYYVGDRIPGFKPVAVDGLPPRLPLEVARAVVISMPTSGAVALAHIVGTTPEAPTLEAASGGRKPEHVIRVGKREITETWQRLNIWDDDVVEHVTFGCPHATIDEIGKIAALLQGKTIKTSLLIGASVCVEAFARRQGYVDVIEKAGGHIIPVCPSIRNPFTRRDIAGKQQARSAATNSARAAHYLATVSGVKTFFGTDEECVSAAITGKWKGKIPQ